MTKIHTTVEQAVLLLENPESEIWKDILGREGLYQISSFGRVKNLLRYTNYKHRIGNKILKHRINHDGYPCVMFGRKLFRTHRLVAIAFHDNPLNLPEVNHINGI